MDNAELCVRCKGKGLIPIPTLFYHGWMRSPPPLLNRVCPDCEGMGWKGKPAFILKRKS